MPTVQPPQYYYPSPLNPAPFGLLDSSTTVFTGDYVHYEAGVVLIPTNVGTAWGSWPTDPCASPNPVQRVTLTGGSTGTTFTLAVDLDGAVQTTASIAYNAAPAAVQSALNALEGIVVAVTGATGNWLVEFLEPDLAFADAGRLELMLAAVGGDSTGSAPTLHTTWVSGNTRKQAFRPDWSEAFVPGLEWGYDECDPTVPDDESQARARQMLSLHFGYQTEKAFGDTILTLAGTPDTADDIDQALGMLEEYLGVLGPSGYLHAARRYASLGANAQNVIRNGGRLETPLTNRWVFGSGYAETLGDTIVATLPTLAWVFNPLPIRTSVDIRDGEHMKMSVAEQPIIVAVEGPAYAVTVAPQ